MQALRANLTTWFNFYNGYDPMFTWWMGLPYKKIDAALERYSRFSRKGATAGVTDAAGAPPHRRFRRRRRRSSARCRICRPDPRAAAGRDDAIVQRFIGATGGGGRGATAAAAPPRAREFYTGWLAALKTLDFDKLSRNAQVDYLFIRKASERAIARDGLHAAGQHAPQDRQQRHPGAARGRDGLILDLPTR